MGEEQSTSSDFTVGMRALRRQRRQHGTHGRMWESLLTSEGRGAASPGRGPYHLTPTSAMSTPMYPRERTWERSMLPVPSMHSRFKTGTTPPPIGTSDPAPTRSRLSQCLVEHVPSQEWRGLGMVSGDRWVYEVRCQA